jgi:hypothetical protein
VPATNAGDGSSEEVMALCRSGGQGGDVNLLLSGYRNRRRLYFDGFYQVKYGGMHQGINGLGLTPARTMDVEPPASR